jgi:folate-binding protein YgfZ
MITNDVNHLSSSTGTASCIYAMFLNKGGRVLYDSLIYRSSSPDPERIAYLIECDKTISNNLAKHLKLYRVRRKIDITISDEYDLWCLQSTNKPNKNEQQLSIHPDPRLKEIGYRIITSKDQDVKKSIGAEFEEASLEEYLAHRYQHGICEGVVDLPPEKCFPLEANCDYMHGVSFHKGCYIGQELTARTHHTGVVRKRLMPLEFEKSITFNLTETVDVKNQENQSVGKVRNIIGTHGLGLLRIEQALSATKLTFNANDCTTKRPSWWPIEAEKTSRLPKN